MNKHLNPEKIRYCWRNGALYVHYHDLRDYIFALAKKEHETEYCSIQSIASAYGMSAVRLNQYLCAKHIQYRRGGVWHINARYAKRGYVNKTGRDSHTHLRWNNKGKEFIESLLAQDGIEKIHK